MTDDTSTLPAALGSEIASDRVSHIAQLWLSKRGGAVDEPPLARGLVTALTSTWCATAVRRVIRWARSSG